MSCRAWQYTPRHRATRAYKHWLKNKQKIFTLGKNSFKMPSLLAS